MNLSNSRALDTHDAGSAIVQAELYQDVASELAGVWKLLRETPFDAQAGKSFLDVTTVLVTSEFARTMRQLSAPIDKTGTDHNALTNSILLGGKGIKGGLVVGASDLCRVDDQGDLMDISGAHRQRDPKLIKHMGRPFDFSTLRPVEALPEVFRLEDYLQFTSVINTVLACFGVGSEHYLPRSANGSSRPTPVLAGLLA